MATHTERTSELWSQHKERVTVLCFVASFTSFSSVGRPFRFRMSSTNFPQTLAAQLLLPTEWLAAFGGGGWSPFSSKSSGTPNWKGSSWPHKPAVS